MAISSAMSALPIRAFSSEVDAGSREENASKQESRASVLIRSEPIMLQGLPGTRPLFEGFYKVRFQLGTAVGRSVMYARDGKMLGGNSAFAHIGSYVKGDDGIEIVIQTVR